MKTSGFGALGLNVAANGDVTVASDTVLTSGDYSTGVFARPSSAMQVWTALM